MSSALDEETRDSLAAGRDTAAAMLRAAQKDLQKVFIVFLVGFIGTFYALRLYVWDFLKSVTEAQMAAATVRRYEIIAQTPFDVILLQAKIGMAVGIVFALPVFVWFSRDALRVRGLWPSAPVARWKLAGIALVASVLFVGGLSYGYLVFFPFMFAFLAGNAISVGFQPTYSIVLWAQFILLLTVSFGVAAQLPLAVTALSYAGIVPYETFREKWRHAVVSIFAFGALFTPPDPFTQVMWATPMLVLYGVSLYCAKVAVTAKRGREAFDPRLLVREHWNSLAGATLVGFLAVYGFYTRGGVAAANAALAAVGSSYTLLPAGSTLGVAPGTAAAVYGVGGALLGLAVAAGYHTYRDLEASVDPLEAPGAPAEVDVSALDAAGVRAAPPEAFAAMSEDEAVELAERAIEDDDRQKARAVLDRFDEADAERETEREESAQSGIEGRARRAAGTFTDEMGVDDEDEAEFEGLLEDAGFVLDSVTSKSFRILVVFAAVLSVSFGWLYTGGIGDVFEAFQSRLPEQVTIESLNVVTLHPMEALIFQVKFSMIVAIAAILPMLAWYAWPALREKGIVRRRKGVIFGWVGALLVGLFGGFALGYLYVAPAIIGYLVTDAVRANMVIAYRISDFFWLIVLTTAGIGVLVDIPVLMVLLNTAGLSYQRMRGRWREVTVGLMVAAALFTPADALTMILVTVPLMAAYGLGLGVLALLTVGGRRNLATPRGEWGDDGDAAA
ncbi:MAG: twin-arginine translocase subunit TatC [Haloferacaceae archaeon]